MHKYYVFFRSNNGRVRFVDYCRTQNDRRIASSRLQNRYINLYIYILESYLISVAKCNHLLVFNIGCANRQDPIIAWPWDDNVIFARLIKLINYANCVRTAGRACTMSEAYICAGAVDLEVDRGALICFVECSRRDAVTEIYVISD